MSNYLFSAIALSLEEGKQSTHKTSSGLYPTHFTGSGASSNAPKNREVRKVHQALVLTLFLQLVLKVNAKKSNLNCVYLLLLGSLRFVLSGISLYSFKSRYVSLVWEIRVALKLPESDWYLTLIYRITYIVFNNI